MSEVKVNKLSPRSGTTVTLGDSGDTITIPSGVTLDASSGGLAGTLTTAAQSGVTSLGTLTALNVAGNTTITTTDNSNTLSLVSTDADATSAPRLSMRRESGSPADNDIIGQIYFNGKDDGGNDTDYASIRAKISDATHNTEDGALEFQSYRSGFFNNSLTLGPTETVFNDDSVDIDFRVESNGNANMLFVDGGNDRVGIGTSSPNRHLTVQSTTNAEFSLTAGNSSKSQIFFADTDDTNIGRIEYEHTNNAAVFWTNDAERMRIDSSGNVGISTASPVAPLTVASGSDTGAISLGGDVSSSGITNNTRKIGRLVVPSYATAEEPVGVILADFNGSDNQIAIGGGSSSVNSATKILFLTGANSTTASGTERMNLGSSGALKIAKDGAAFNSNTAHQFIDSGANTYSLMVSNKASSPASQYMIEVGFKSAAPDNNSARFMQFIDNSATRAEIMSDGDFRSHDNSYGSTSDERIKQDIVDSGSQWDDIKAVKVRKFKKKDDVRQYGDEAWVQIGVIAQELEAAGMDKLIKHSDPNSSDILSDSTFGTLYKDGDEIPEGKVIGDIKEIKTQIKSVGYSVLYMKAIKALQEAMTRIETLEAEVTALKNQP